MVPSCATAGELKMMSPVAYDHLSVPSRATAYSLPSCDPTSTDPSPAIAGDDTIGPPVATVHQIGGLGGRQHERRAPAVGGPEPEHRLRGLDRVLRQRQRDGRPGRPAAHGRPRAASRAARRSGPRRTAD